MGGLLGVAGVHPLFAVREEHARRRHPQRGRNFVGREDTVRRKLLTKTKSVTTPGGGRVSEAM